MSSKQSIKLTETRVERSKYDPDGPKIQRLWDNEAKGLGLELFKTGRKSWIHRYRLDGKQRIIKLGDVFDLTLEEARDKVRGNRQDVRAGVDPKIIMDAPHDEMTLNQLFDKYTSTRYYKTRSDDFRFNMESTYRKYLRPTIGDRRLSTITRREIRTMVESLIEQGKEGAARGLLNRARIIFNYTLEQDLLENSPADHIKPKYVGTGKREQWLETAEELREVWWWKGDVQTRALLRWLLLTGCRRDEARTTEHSWITDTTWRVEDTKNGHDLVLPMMPQMQTIQDEMQSSFPGSPFLFPATTSSFKALPRGTLDYMIRTGSGGKWSAHILRHTVETHLRELRIGEEQRDLILNHVRQGSGARYSHGEALALKREALEKWHEKLMGAVS